jgi:hypothetical protein
LQEATLAVRLAPQIGTLSVSQGAAAICLADAFDTLRPERAHLFKERPAFGERLKRL